MRTLKLYRMSPATKQIQEWEIGHQRSVIVIKYGQQNGLVQVKTETILIGKGGRSLEQQIIHRMKSRVRKQLDKGYKVSVKEAISKIGTNALGFYRPMLAHNLHKVNGVDWENAIVQPKFDGHRCMVFKLGGKLIAYTRQGKIITTISHILENIDIPEGTTIDGELYCHRESLQVLSSWIKRKQENTKKLKYIIYDVVSKNTYIDRLNWLLNAHDSIANNIAEYTLISEKNHISKLFKVAKQQGYEGIIVRQNNKGYGAGERCTSLIKVKQLPGMELIEKEFLVLDVLPSKDGWGILKCRLSSGLEFNTHASTFNTPAPGTIEQKTEILTNKRKYIGRYVTVEFPQYTDEGKPFHAVALRFKEEI